MSGDRRTAIRLTMLWGSVVKTDSLILPREANSNNTKICGRQIESSKVDYKIL